MIDPTSQTTQGASASLTTSESTLSGLTTGSGFSAAVEAANRAAAKKQAQDAEFAEIREKGFTAWVRDTQIEKLKEELRKRIIAEMGLTEDDIATMGSVIRQTLEARIKDEVEKRLATTLASTDSASASNQSTSSANDNQSQGSTVTRVAKAASTVLAAQEHATSASPTQTEEEKKDRQGNFGMVIPALAMPGGASLF
ncbi:hypothetical protein SAMN04244559_01376 [Magnetospirillum fulvum]|uniref:Uncharacterized protein n=1 Tax=Magnetospirillum fulvum TaxID=1082 RepID=A0A1H6HD80_MAGFU|nr:hypothetical protein SAMN04244559_01376 [Magnetospirillum fulvum]